MLYECMGKGGNIGEKTGGFKGTTRLVEGRRISLVVSDHVILN